MIDWAHFSIKSWYQEGLRRRFLVLNFQFFRALSANGKVEWHVVLISSTQTHINE